MQRRLQRTTKVLDWRPTFGTLTSGNLSYTDLNAMGADLVVRLAGDSMARPIAGGTLTINSVSLGSYDVVYKRGNQTISTFDPGDWFTNTEDSRSAIIVVDGDLTINAGQILIPSVRKLFAFLYVTGTLTVNGAISMRARGANHSASGSNITAGAIRIATGTFSAVVDPNVPAAGGAGGASNANGTAGSAGGTGGGGGSNQSSGIAGAAGAAGTSFCGGTSAGSSGDIAGGTAGAVSGGAGGNGGTVTAVGACGGVGNPGGVGARGNFYYADNGTPGLAGTLVIILPSVGTSYAAGSGTVDADGTTGAAGGAGSYAGSGGGGGSVTIMTKTNIGPSPTAVAGAVGAGAGIAKTGGAGTARVLIIP